MKQLLSFALFLVLQASAVAGSFTVHVTAPKEAGNSVLLYHYAEHFSLRTIRMDAAMLNSEGKASLKGSVEGTARMQIRIGDAIADLYVRSGSNINVEWPGPDPRIPRSLNRAVRVPIVFVDMDPLDINALTSDLNERLDDFLIEDLATDAAGGMQALDVKRKDNAAPDSSSRPPTLFVTPMLSASRVDSFEFKLQRFYKGIDDPWFQEYLSYGIAGLRHGPRANDRELFERYLKGREVQYSNPEYVRFVRGMFEDILLTFALRNHSAALDRAMAAGNLDSLKAILSEQDFLRDEPRLCELVALDQLHAAYNSKLVDTRGAERMLKEAAETSKYAEHRLIAANLLWDLTTMRPGTALPAMRLTDLNGKTVEPALLNEGPVCLVFTATWCTYCELEMVGLAQLQKEYGELIPIVVVSLDKEASAVKDYLKTHPGHKFTWLHAEAEQQLREDLRLRSLPAVFLLQDGMLVRSPAPLPSGGLGEVFHRARVKGEQDGRIKVWDD